MPAIVTYLADIYGLVPSNAAARATALKVLLDCNDVLANITRSNGSQMWTQELW